MNFFTFINETFLKMTWLKDGVGELLHFIVDQSGLPLREDWVHILQFFIYDFSKIFILMSTLIFFISFIQSYFPPERTSKILSRFKGFSANLLSALFGTITPFCSCSSIPLFIGFTSVGLPIGVTFSFLISSPLVDLASIILLASIFNWRIAIAYVIVGLLLATIGGSIISYLKLEGEIESYVFKKRFTQNDLESLTLKERFDVSYLAVKDIVTKVWLYILIGVWIGALIHNVVPQAWINLALGKQQWYSVFLATLIGIPIYADIFGVLPIAVALVDKGVGIGTVLALMMAITTLSLPSLMMLKRVMSTKLLAIFVLIVTTGIILIGTLFNHFSLWFI